MSSYQNSTNQKLTSGRGVGLLLPRLLDIVRALPAHVGRGFVQDEPFSVSVCFRWRGRHGRTTSERTTKIMLPKVGQKLLWVGRSLFFCSSSLSVAGDARRRTNADATAMAQTATCTRHCHIHMRPAHAYYESSRRYLIVHAVVKAIDLHKPFASCLTKINHPRRPAPSGGPSSARVPSPPT